MPTQPLYQQSRAQGMPLNDTHPIETPGSRIHEAKLVNRFLSGLKFYIPVYSTLEHRTSPLPYEIISDFLIHMDLKDNITYGALILLCRLARLEPLVKLNGHAYFMGAYSLSAQALLDSNGTSALFAPKAHHFVKSNALMPFLWKDVETARTRIYNDNRNNLKLDNILDRFKTTVDKDFRLNGGIPCPNYPPNLATEHPKFLYPRRPRSRDEYTSNDDDDEFWNYYTSFHIHGGLPIYQSPLVKDKVGSSNRGWKLRKSGEIHYTTKQFGA